MEKLISRLVGKENMTTKLDLKKACLILVIKLLQDNHLLDYKIKCVSLDEDEDRISLVIDIENGDDSKSLTLSLNKNVLYEYASKLRK